jgi:hypothetical protein
MFGSLKEKAMEKAVATLESELGPVIQEKVDMFKDLQPCDVNDDEKYKNIIVSPLWAFVKLQTGGAIGLAQKFIDIETKFHAGLFNVRDELVKVDGQTVSLDPEFSDKLLPVLMKSIKG